MPGHVSEGLLLGCVCQPYSRPAYMDYTAVTSELPPRDTKLRR